VYLYQKRLQKIGHYQPTHQLFNNIYDIIEKHAYPHETLKQAALIHEEINIDEKLSLPDYQIIQKMHAIDDLLHSINMFDERIDTWKVFSIDHENLTHFQHLQEEMNHKVQSLQEEIKNQITVLAPNTSYLIGPLLTARLLVHARSLEKLSKLPASSVQLLGAEKALFRFKKEGGKPPKHGVLYQHESLIKASKKEKGRIARLLSLKIILAIRADVYTKRDIGKMLKDDFEEQIKQLNKKPEKSR